MRSDARCLLRSVLIAVMACPPVRAGNTYTPCYTLVLVSPSGPSTCPPCAYMPPNSYYCPAGVSQTITTSYWKCAPAPPGASGRVSCPKTRIQIGVVQDCAMFPNTAAILACLVGADKCLDICAPCVVPGAGWLACAPCAACILVLGANCTGCHIRTCAGDPGTTRPLYGYAGSLTGAPCVGN